ncbi:MAG: DNA polymerase I [Blautia sp.]|nr:DNA polymerase I [Blautia sp.]
MSEKILLIDGHSIINRSFYGLPDLTNSEGVHTGAVYGFLTTMFRVLDEEKPDYLIVAFDTHAPTFRHKKYPEYKGTRHKMPEELAAQVPLLQEMLGAMGIPIVSMEGFEADDILGTLSKRCEKDGMDVTVLSGDRDLLQLASDHIMIMLPRTVKGQTTIERFHTEEVIAKYQVTPPQIIELKALMGDSSDNIPGLPGVGEKTATKLITAYGNIDNVKAHADEIKGSKVQTALRDHFDKAVLSRELATIDTDAPVIVDMESARTGGYYTREAYELCRRLEFKNLLGRFESGMVQDTVSSMEPFVINDEEGCRGAFSKAAEKTAVGITAVSSGGRILCAALALPDDEVYVLEAGASLTAELISGSIRELPPSVVICSMDIKSLLKSAELDTDRPVFDAGVAAYLLNPLKSTYTYDDIAREYLDGRLFLSREELIGRKSIDKALSEDAENVHKYIAAMAGTALLSREPLLNELALQGMDKIYNDIELPLIFTLDEMEKAGIRVNGNELSHYGEKLEVRIGELEKQIWKEAGEEFNINSPKQMGVILFEKLSLPGGKKTKTGYSTSADILEKLSPEHQIVRDILEYRQLTKLKSTYADGLTAVIADDGRIHSTFNQTITATGRISSTEPNLQNIPVRMELGREIRKVFIPEKGYVFLDADYSQIELRVLAHMSGDENLIAAYREAKDIHRITASQVFHVPFDEVTDLMRRNAKAVNFGIVYGISSFGLSQDLSITRKEASEYIEKYFETYPKIREFLDRLVKDAKEKGYAETMYGRRRPVPELKSGNFMQRSFGERAAMNSPIQGTAADIIKIAMNRVNRRLKAEGLDARLVLQVHDELLIEARESCAEKAAEILVTEMKNASDLSVMLEADMHQGYSWYEAK